MGSTSVALSIRFAIVKRLNTVKCQKSLVVCLHLNLFKKYTLRTLQPTFKKTRKHLFHPVHTLKCCLIKHQIVNTKFNMTTSSPSIQERLQLRREPLDKWSLREQLCLASAVARSGDQNWMSVSRALKPFGESNRPADWFHQKNCAVQYGALLGNVETPKRKKRSGSDTVIETPPESILRQLIADRKAELKALLAEEKAEYKKLQEDMKILQSGEW